MTGKSFRTGSEQAIYDVRLDRECVLVACGLGGRSLVNAGVSLVPDKRVFVDDAWPARSRRTERSRRATGAPSQLGRFRPTRIRDDEVRRARTRGAGLGGTLVLAHRRQLRGHYEPSGHPSKACTRCGDCCAGCNVGAKNTVALTYLPMPSTGRNLHRAQSGHRAQGHGRPMAGFRARGRQRPQ